MKDWQQKNNSPPPDSQPLSDWQYVKPFEGQKNFTVVQNICFDYVMPSLSGSAWKVLCFIIRKTIGWDKDADQLSYSQIKEGTQIKSDPTITTALRQLMGLVVDVDADGKKVLVRDELMPDYIICEGGATVTQANTYWLNLDLEIGVLQKLKYGDARTLKIKDTKEIVPSNKSSKSLSNKRVVGTNQVIEVSSNYPAAQNSKTDSGDFPATADPDLSDPSSRDLDSLINELEDSQ